jgi:hypothetical protein
MPILSAFGLGVLIIVLKLLVPAIFGALQSAIIAFLNGATISANIASQLAASAGTIQLPHH